MPRNELPLFKSNYGQYESGSWRTVETSWRRRKKEEENENASCKLTPSRLIRLLTNCRLTVFNPCSCAIAWIPAQVEILTGLNSRIGRLKRNARVAMRVRERAARVEEPFPSFGEVESVEVRED